VHVSDFSSPDNMNQELQVGQKHEFKIVSIEPQVHKMALSLVRLENAAKTEVAAPETSVPESETPKTE